MAREYALYENLGDVDMCGVFAMFKVKVLVIFFATAGFSPCRDRRYAVTALVWADTRGLSSAVAEPVELMSVAREPPVTRCGHFNQMWPLAFRTWWVQKREGNGTSINVYPLKGH
jgi:hypothetical protein